MGDDSPHVTTTIPFRAGRHPSIISAAMPPDFGADVVLMVDISEFQPDINDAVYLKWSLAAVIRAMYGDAHSDKAWYGGARRADLHAGGVRFLGIYQYIVASQDITAQARAFCKLIGKLQPGEVPIADIEEGAGDQSGRRNTWHHVVETELGFSPWVYSGLNFAADHGLAPVDWVAAYGSAEPTVPHKLWQFTDSFNIPGVGTADCSVWHSTIDQLAALAFGGSQPAPSPVPVSPPPIPVWQEAMVNALPYVATAQDIQASGLAPAMSQDAAGGVLFVHRVQQLANGISSWNGLGVTLTVDGAYGPLSKAGLERIQQFFGLGQDGIVGPQTWGALVAG